MRASTGSPCRAFFHPGGPSDRTCRWSSGRGLFRSLKIGQSGWREGCGFPSCSEPTSQHPLSATFEDLQKNDNSMLASLYTFGHVGGLNFMENVPQSDSEKLHTFRQVQLSGFGDEFLVFVSSVEGINAVRV